MNSFLFALLCHFVTTCVKIYGCRGQQFAPLYDLYCVQRTDKLDGTIDPPITEGVRISYSIDSLEYRIHAIGLDNIETFHQNGMRKIFMVGDVVKIIVLDTENVWICQFLVARSAREFYDRHNPRESTNDLPYFDIDVVSEKAPGEQQTFRDVALYMKPYGLPENDRKMFFLKPSPRTGQSYPILTVFLSGRFSIERIGDLLRLTYGDAEDRSSTLVIYNNGETNVDAVYDAISSYARCTYTDDTGWVSNPYYDELESFFLH